MTHESTITLERRTPKIASVTFANPPANLIVSETVTRLDEILRELDDDPDIQVVIFTSGVPDFFFNHFDLAAARDFPVPQGEEAVPMWTDIVLRLSRAPYITIASIRGRTRGGGNELALAFDLRYASREKAIFGQPEVGGGLLPGGGSMERLPRTIGRDLALRSSSPAPTTTHPPPKDGAGSPAPCPTPSWMPSSTPSSPGSHRSTAPRSPPPRRWSTGRCCRRMPTSSPPTASSRTPSPFPDSSLSRHRIPGAVRRSRNRRRVPPRQYIGIANQRR
jgi:Enoyl-CoA hydratase/isomerase